MELFLFNLVDAFPERKVDPMENVKHLHACHEQFHVHIPTSDDVNSHKTLQLNHILMKHWSWKSCKELDNEVVRRDVRNFTLLLGSGRSNDVQERLNNVYWYFLGVVITEMLVVHQQKQSSGTHQLQLLVTFVLAVLVLNNLDQRWECLVEVVRVGLCHALTQLLEVEFGTLVVNCVISHPTLLVWHFLFPSCLSLGLFFFSYHILGNFLEGRDFINLHLWFCLVFRFFVRVALCLRVLERSAEGMRVLN